MAAAQAETAGPADRPGPRPIGLHLNWTLLCLWSSCAGFPAWRNGWTPSSIDTRRTAIPAALRKAERQLRDDIDAYLGDGGAAETASTAAAGDRHLAAALVSEAQRRLAAFLKGVAGYRGHPYRRQVSSHPVVWGAGSTRLVDHGGADAAPVALLVPSLINRSYILDLMPDRSFCEALRASGIRPFRLSWGRPGPDEARFGLADYISERLIPSLAIAVRANGGRPVPIVGYCMGGTLAVAAAALRPDLVSGLALLATPWDFHADRADQARAVAALFRQLEPAFRHIGTVNVDFLQSLFAANDPFFAYDKFRRFGALDPESDEAVRFVALEDWLNDGVPLTVPVGEECLAGWYGENRTAEGLWRIDDVVIDPEALRMPTLSIIPRSDRIVPPASAGALADALPDSERLFTDAGHIGMMVGRQASDAVWRPVAEWLLTRDK